MTKVRKKNAIRPIVWVPTLFIASLLAIWAWVASLRESRKLDLVGVASHRSDADPASGPWDAGIDEEIRQSRDKSRVESVTSRGEAIPIADVKLIFPPSDHLGFIDIRDPGARGWTFLGFARGTVTLPAGKEVRFEAKPIRHLNLAFLAQFPAGSMRELVLRGTSLDDSSAKLLSRFSRLQLLDISKTKIGDAALGSISSATGLESLSLAETRVTGEGMESLRNLKHLRLLDLSATRVDDKGLLTVAGLSEIQDLRLATPLVQKSPKEHWQVIDARITDVGVAALKGLPSLKSLSLTDTAIGDHGLEDLAEIKTLARLSLRWSSKEVRATSQGMSRISKLTSLQRLEIDNRTETALVEAAAKAVGPLHGLRSAKFSGGVERDGLVQLGTLRGLEELEVEFYYGKSISDDAWAPLGNLASLKRLRIRYTTIGHEALRQIGNLKSLEELNLEGCDIPVDGLALLSKLQFLKSLSLRDDRQISDKGLEPLAQLASLRALDIRGTSLNNRRILDVLDMSETSKRDNQSQKLLGRSLMGAKVWWADYRHSGLKNLMKLTQLEELHLDEKGNIRSSDMAEIRQALPNCRVNGRESLNGPKVQSDAK